MSGPFCTQTGPAENGKIENQLTSSAGCETQTSTHNNNTTINNMPKRPTRSVALLSATFSHISDPGFAPSSYQQGSERLDVLSGLETQQTAHDGVVDQPQGLLGSAESRREEAVCSQNTKYFHAVQLVNLAGLKTPGDAWIDLLMIKKGNLC